MESARAGYFLATETTECRPRSARYRSHFRQHVFFRHRLRSSQQVRERAREHQGRLCSRPMNPRVGKNDRMKAVAGRSNKSWIAVAMRIAVGVSLLIVPAQLCLASDARREAADGWWSAWGKNVKTELNALPDAGRKAFRDALIACSLYADEYNSDVRGAECKRAVKAFTVEYGRDHSPIELTFN